MQIGPTQRLGPTLKTTWGDYPSPYFTQPARNARMMEYLPPTIQGRHVYREQPRSIRQMPADPAAMIRGASNVLQRTRGSLVPDEVVARGVGAADPQRETKLGAAIFVGLIVAGMFFGGAR